MTNYEKIKQEFANMSLDEMANILENERFLGCYYCLYKDKVCCPATLSCEEAIKKYLEQEAEE